MTPAEFKKKWEYIVRTNFNGTVQETHEFRNADLDNPANIHILRAVFFNPDLLKPKHTTAEITEKLAEQTLPARYKGVSLSNSRT